MFSKVIETILTKFLTTANIRLSLPVLAGCFMAAIVYQTRQINSIAASVNMLTEQTKVLPATIQGKIDNNNVLLFGYGMDIMKTWIDKTNSSMKSIALCIQVSDRERALLIQNIDRIPALVSEQASISKTEMIYKVIPDSLQVKGKRIRKAPIPPTDSLNAYRNE